MKKKLMAVILSVMMLVCFAATAMAAPAPSPSADVKISTVKAVVDGKEVEIDLSNLKITVTDSAVKEELNTSDKIACNCRRCSQGYGSGKTVRSNLHWFRF